MKFQWTSESDTDRYVPVCASRPREVGPVGIVYLDYWKLGVCTGGSSWTGWILAAIQMAMWSSCTGVFV